MEQPQQNHSEPINEQQAAAKAAILAECDKLLAAGIKFVAVHFDVSVRRAPYCQVSTNRLSGHFGRCGMEIPRQQFVDAVDGMVGDAGQHFMQIGFGIETVELRRTD